MNKLKTVISHSKKPLISFVIYKFALLLPKQKTVFYSSYRGIGRDPAIEYLANLHQYTFPNHRRILDQPEWLKYFPALIERIYVNCRYHFQLASSEVLIMNMHAPRYFRKRNKQVYIQTWHGIPIKRLGKDRLGFLYSRKYAEDMAREVASWDLLISSGHFESLCLQSAFGRPKELLELGPLRHAQFEISRKNVEQGLSRFSLKKSILFAPTWREGSEAKFENYDPLVTAIQIAEAFSDHLVFFKFHHKFTPRIYQAIPSNLNLIKANADLSVLYQEIDLLITDYSSIAFDFAYFKKPILFFVPDMAEYRVSPGIYFEIDRIFYSMVATEFNVLCSKIYAVLNQDQSFDTPTKAFSTFYGLMSESNIRLEIISRFSEF